MTDFEGLTQRLARAKIEFILIGGRSRHGTCSTRLTTDLDIVYADSA